MTVLLAREFTAGRFSKVLVFKARQDGGGALAAKWHGGIESLAVRTAAKFFAGETKATDMCLSYGSHSFRATRIG